jgi:hypothetical protein
MRLKPLIVATLVVMLASIAGQAVGAANGQGALSIFAASAFAGAIGRVGFQINQPWWSHDPSLSGPATATALPAMAGRNAALLALGYLWGGLSLLAVYLLTPVQWQHGWQYGGGMVLLGGIIYAISRTLSAMAPARFTPGLARILTWLTLLHGWAATGAVGWLIGSGKVWSLRGDWAANVIFVTGALVIGVISIFSLRTQRILSTTAQTDPQQS